MYNIYIYLQNENLDRVSVNGTIAFRRRRERGRRLAFLICILTGFLKVMNILRHVGRFRAFLSHAREGGREGGRKPLESPTAITVTAMAKKKKKEKKNAAIIAAVTSAR